MMYDIFVNDNLRYGDVNQGDLIDLLNIIESEFNGKDYTIFVKGKK